MELPAQPPTTSRPEDIKNFHEHIAWHENTQMVKIRQLRAGSQLGTGRRNSLWERLNASTATENRFMRRVISVIRHTLPPSRDGEANGDGDGGGGGGGHGGRRGGGRDSGRDSRRDGRRDGRRGGGERERMEDNHRGGGHSSGRTFEGGGGRPEGEADGQGKPLSPSVGGVQGSPPRRTRDGLSRAFSESPRQSGRSAFAGGGRSNSPVKGRGRGPGGVGRNRSRLSCSGNDFTRDRSNSSSSRSASREHEGRENQMSVFNPVVPAPANTRDAEAGSRRTNPSTNQHDIVGTSGRQLSSSFAETPTTANAVCSASAPSPPATVTAVSVGKFGASSREVLSVPETGGRKVGSSCETSAADIGCSAGIAPKGKALDPRVAPRTPAISMGGVEALSRRQAVDIEERVSAPPSPPPPLPPTPEPSPAAVCPPSVGGEQEDSDSDMVIDTDEAPPAAAGSRQASGDSKVTKAPSAIDIGSSNGEKPGEAGSVSRHPSTNEMQAQPSQPGCMSSSPASMLPVTSASAASSTSIPIPSAAPISAGSSPAASGAPTAASGAPPVAALHHPGDPMPVSDGTLIPAAPTVATSQAALSAAPATAYVVPAPVSTMAPVSSPAPVLPVQGPASVVSQPLLISAPQPAPPPAAVLPNVEPIERAHAQLNARRAHETNVEPIERAHAQLNARRAGQVPTQYKAAAPGSPRAYRPGGSSSQRNPPAYIPGGGAAGSNRRRPPSAGVGGVVHQTEHVSQHQPHEQVWTWDQHHLHSSPPGVGGYGDYRGDQWHGAGPQRYWSGGHR